MEKVHFQETMAKTEIQRLHFNDLSFNGLLILPEKTTSLNSTKTTPFTCMSHFEISRDIQQMSWHDFPSKTRQPRRQCLNGWRMKWWGGPCEVAPASGPNLPKFLQPWTNCLVMVMVKPHFLRWNLTKASGLEAIFLIFSWNISTGQAAFVTFLMIQLGFWKTQRYLRNWTIKSWRKKVHVGP